MKMNCHSVSSFPRFSTFPVCFFSSSYEDLDQLQRIEIGNATFFHVTSVNIHGMLSCCLLTRPEIAGVAPVRRAELLWQRPGQGRMQHRFFPRSLSYTFLMQICLGWSD